MILRVKLSTTWQPPQAVVCRRKVVPAKLSGGRVVLCVRIALLVESAQRKNQTLAPSGKKSEPKRKTLTILTDPQP